MNLKNKCHVRRLKPRKKIYFRKEKGLVEKEATSPSSKERVEKFGYTSSQISNVNRNNVIFQHISILKKNLLHLYSFTYFIHNLLCLKCSFSSLFLTSFSGCILGSALLNVLNIFFDFVISWQRKYFSCAGTAGTPAPKTLFIKKLYSYTDTNGVVILTKLTKIHYLYN